MIECGNAGTGRRELMADYAARCGVLAINGKYWFAEAVTSIVSDIWKIHTRMLNAEI